MKDNLINLSNMINNLINLSLMIDALYKDGNISTPIYRQMSKDVNKCFDYIQGEK